ncbi:AT hook domain-containing protein [Rutstroemia sp. NJR-2017a BBW]|nr:AT hook domain-containing protein [Rutstroemia sp. NJR-2017a BBW]
MVQLAEGDKTAAPAKNMALDLLGSMGAAISELNSHVRKTAAAIEYRDDPMGQALSRMTDEALENRGSVHELVSWKGPFYMSLDYMENRCQSEPQLASGLAFLIAEWAAKATVRTKSLRSVNQVLETDPSILDREPAVKQMILRCSNDSSPQVRDSALGLIGKCIGLRPAFEVEMTPSILQRVTDSGASVRKRALKLLKDIYLNNSNKEVRSAIADAMLHRVTDLDDGVQELARSTIEEVWMLPFYKAATAEENTVQAKLAISDHVALIIKTAQRQNGVSGVLDKVIQNMLSKKSKYPDANFKVCKALVAAMFETIIDNSSSEDSDAPKAKDALDVLTIFAKSDPNLFTADQIQLLQPYVSNIYYRLLQEAPDLSWMI